MTPQLRKLIDDINNKDSSVVYKTTDGKKLTVIKTKNALTIQADDPQILPLLAKILELAINGQLQRKPLTKDKK